jgi:hypothetical protein
MSDKLNTQAAVLIVTGLALSTVATTARGALVSALGAPGNYISFAIHGLAMALLAAAIFKAHRGRRTDG